MNILKFLKWRLPCKTCRVDGIYGSIWNQFPELRFVENWKFGKLYQCSKCQSRWYLPEHQHSMGRIEEKLWEKALYWNQTPLILKPHLIEALTDIGGVLQDGTDTISIPCSIVNISGETHERALVLISKKPPFWWYNPTTVHWANEIQILSPSDSALPFDVRKATMEQKEVAMGFAPVGIINSLGEEATLPCESHFIDHKNMKGPSIRLSGRTKQWKKSIYPSAAQTYYFADWFKGCELVSRSAN